MPINVSDIFDKKPEKKDSLVDILKRQIEKESAFELPPSDKPLFRASGIGKCGRAQLLKLNGIKGHQEAGSQMTLSAGHSIHEIIQKYLQNAGILKSLEIKTFVTEGLDGSYDGVLQFNGHESLLEIKTMNCFAYQRQVLYKKIYKYYIVQAHCYMGGLRKQGHKIKGAYFLFVNKNGILEEQFEKEHPEVDPVFYVQYVPFDESIWQEIEIKVQELTKHFHDKTLPPYKSCSECKYCKVEKICKERYAQEKEANKQKKKNEKSAAKSDKPISTRKPRKNKKDVS